MQGVLQGRSIEGAVRGLKFGWQGGESLGAVGAYSEEGRWFGQEFCSW